MGNLSILLFCTAFSATFCSTVEPSFEPSDGEKDTSLESRMSEVEKRLLAMDECDRCDDVKEIKDMLMNLTREIGAISTQLSNIQDSCADDPPSLQNGKAKDFGRKPGSTVQYECDRDFVLTGNSTVRCESGKWEGNPPTCSYWDATFYAEVSYWNIECYSESNANKIRFSRAVDTGTGLVLPRNVKRHTSAKSASMDLSDVHYPVYPGAYRCGFRSEERSAEIIVPLETYAYLHFPDPFQKVCVGDNVTLRLRSFRSLPSHWSRDGIRLPSWDGKKKVFIEEATEEYAGIYSARVEGDEADTAIMHLIVRRCKADLYGERCDQLCPPCHNGGVCHDLLGVCVCPEGFVGRNCETPCPVGFYGYNCKRECGYGYCQRRFYCKPDPYGCACARGFKGAWCGDECEPGWYGADCKQQCHCARNPHSCNRFTGACAGGCATGWKGASCQIRDAE